MMRSRLTSVRCRLLPFLLLLVCFRPAHADATLTGTYTMQGNKGAITLTLTQTADGKVTGTMQGGGVTFNLQGFPKQAGGVLGTVRSAEGQMTSYFEALRQGDQLQFSFIGVGAGGDPDYNQVNKFVFSATAGAEPAPRANPAPAPPVGNPLAGPPDFSGKWQGDGLTVDSQRQGNDFIGSITLNGQKMPFTSSAVNGVLHGQFTVGADHFDFDGRLENGVLVLNSDGTTYRLTKPQTAKNPLAAKPAPTNPLAKPNSPAMPASPSGSVPPAKPMAAPAGNAAWKTFTHPTGLTLRYPPTWTAKEGAGALMLTPEDVKQVAGGPSEIFLVTADNANGITTAEDPRLEQAVNGYIGQQFPTFQRSGQTKPIPAGTQPGILLEWEGDSQGFPARIQVMTTILKSFAVSVVAISTKSEIKASRDETVRQIFASLVAGAGQKDPAVVGKWFLYSYKGTGTTGHETKSYMTLLQDGTALWGQNSEFSFQSEGKSQLGDQTWVGGANSQNQSGDRGTWSAGNGQLIVSWGDGTTATYQYRVGQTPANRRLFLTGGNGKTDEWMEVR